MPNHIQHLLLLHSAAKAVIHRQIPALATSPMHTEYTSASRPLAHPPPPYISQLRRRPQPRHLQSGPHHRPRERANVLAPAVEEAER